jgi:RNA polymerase sigma factor (TIGR02999 family)
VTDASDLDLTKQLADARAGDEAAAEVVGRAVFAELQRLAHLQRIRWTGDYTLDTAALVGEAWMKLFRRAGGEWNDRLHFYRVAARAMRQVLVNYAESRRARRRHAPGGEQEFRDDVPVVDHDELVLELDEHLERLGREHPRHAQVAELRYFVGLTIDETAEALGVAPVTVRRDWDFTKAWLKAKLQGEG